MKLLHPILGPVTVARNQKGYYRVRNGKLRNKYLHRAVFEAVAGRPVKEGFHVHHAGPKWCSCPNHLVELQAELHPASQVRHPWTGKFISPREYQKLMEGM